MLEKGIKDKTLEEVTNIIKEVASIHVTLPDRKLDLLRTKKESLSHFRFLPELEQRQNGGNIISHILLHGNGEGSYWTSFKGYS